MTDTTARPDLGPTAEAVKAVAARVRDEQLTGPTPCAGMPVAQLLDHLVGLAYAFRLSARKETGGVTAQAPEPSAEHLDPAWREVLPRHLDELVAAWRDPAAWEGETQAGGVTLPAQVMGAVALNELLIHGWDLARAVGAPYSADPAALAVSESMFPDDEAGGTPGMYGPRVPVPPDASPLDRVIGLSGRDPAWTP
ncbi:TIGR03086 family metal-binding protein [Spirilliplanes yamanashiensis]|uniref:TIGR03086 family protein n=1 Tax=Spirilliplanes yamanashiensis TaxID=42233 RepID=A0A8J3Y3M5_9ACTN|nr:TIGR03086 family metal-binding protein [Spirilliplanes yamanashiensis]MDP9814098.1 uncharacterized protein (TIGR03086 family) [Spirilliplanes yamanashiensis]GIJ00922.1 TIGR03086 family protein [Spirilliplanes yamanashiensis]